MKYKEQIIAVVVLCAVFGGMFAVWQFHFKEIFEGYRSDDAMRETLERTYTQLQETFYGYEPEILIEAWQSQLQPWRNARDERAGYFNFGGWYDIDVTPDESRMLRFWYTEVSNEMVADIYRKVFERMGGYDRFPQDIRQTFHIQREEDWAATDVTMEDVQLNLMYLSFADSLTEFLLDSNVTGVQNIVNWPRRVPAAYSDLLALQTVGLRFTITARDLTQMLDELRLAPRYFTVNRMRITYPYIAYDVEPQLNVAMVLSQANYREPPELPDRPTAADTRPSDAPAARRPATRQAEQGPVRRFWTWFRRNVLYMN